MFDQFGAAGAGGTDAKYPGFTGQMDQLLYRDIDLSGAGDTSLTVSFQYRTQLSTSFGTNNITRQGWFVHDPLTVSTGGSNPNYIQNDATVAAPPTDSLEVYVGAPAEGSVKLSDGTTHVIYDPLRRWFGEVIRSNEGLYKWIFGKGGVTASSSSGNLVIPGSVLAPIRAAGGNKVRLVFRVHTERSFNDALANLNGFSSAGVGAAIIDNVSVAKGVGSATVIGAFEAATDIDNSVGVSALTKWKSTGKAPQAFHHIHQVSPSAGLLYQDLCGQVGNPARTCDLQGQIVSAGDHDHNERSGGTFGTGEQEPFQGIFSPTINFSTPGSGKNNMGLSTSEADATDDYYIDYEIYTGIFDFFNQGNAWRAGFMSYPSAIGANGTGEHKRWGQVRFWPFILFNPDKQCFRDLEAVKGNGQLRTTNLSGIPDSVKIFVGTRQEAYRFGIPQSEFLDGAYWDNISLDIVDGAGADPISVDIWHLYHDTFPANDATGIAGVAAAFDTTTALIKNGLNNAPTTGNTSRFDVPGDTTAVNAEGDSVRVDLVFRILPGPGNYVNAALGVNSQLRAVSKNSAPIPRPALGVANFWSNYMFFNGAKGSPGGHPTAVSGPLAGQKIWSPQVWNSARMDTAEFNNFPLSKRGNIQPGNNGVFMTAYHETELADANRGALGVPRNICFIADTALAVPTSAVICGSGPTPLGTSYPPTWANAAAGFNGVTSTKEGTKIIPDGLLTPGSHVEYFFRRQDGTDNINVATVPDTNVVSPQNSEGPSFDGHRWQEFSVLPDRWKAGNYTHPVLGTVGNGAACMLYVDQNDRRGDERTWVGVADSIGATRSDKYGAHNGWHAAGDGDINDPAGFVRKHIGSPGTTWDMYGVKAAESLNSGSGSIGSRGGVSGLSFADAGNPQINGKSSRQGPSEEMLNAYYKILMVLSGDLNSSIFGPFKDKSQNDYKIQQDFLLSGNTSTPDRGYFAGGDGFVEATDDGGLGSNFLTGFLGVALRNPRYLIESQNTALAVDIIPTAEIDPGLTDVYGVRSACTFTMDVLDQDPGLAGETAVATFYEPVGANAPYISGLVHHHSATNPWISLVDGFNITVLHSRDDYSDRGRLTYYFNVFTHVFAAICPVAGAPTITTDTPGNNDGRLFNFMNLVNNPLKFGSAFVNFGLAKNDHVKIQIFDVSGRLVRTLADRAFTAGEHRLTWDGADNGGKQVARGVYFVRSQHADSKFTGQSKLVVLK